MSSRPAPCALARSTSERTADSAAASDLQRQSEPALRFGQDEGSCHHGSGATGRQAEPGGDLVRRQPAERLEGGLELVRAEPPSPHDFAERAGGAAGRQRGERQRRRDGCERPLDLGPGHLELARVRWV